MSKSAVCIWPILDGSCGKHASVRFAATLGNIDLSGDYCAEHADDLKRLLRDVGAKALAARTDYKRRGVYVTASGTPFSAQEARSWLLEQGLVSSGSGRLSHEQLNEYAEAH